MQLKNIILAIYLSLSFLPYCYGEGLDLHDALNVHVYNTTFVKTKQLELENSLMEYDNFRKSLLPALSLNFTPVSFNHSMRLIQNYITGEYNNVEEYSNTISGGLSLIQKVPLTGGVFMVGSNLSILNEYTNDKQSFSSAPIYFSYSQPLFGGGKSMSFEKAISKLKNETAIKEYCTAVSAEQQKILALYLDAYSNKMDIHFYSKIVNIGDSLLIHTKIRKDVGKVTEYDYNQIEIQQIDNRIALEKSQYAYKASIRLLENELALYDIELDELTMTDFPIQIDEGTVLNLVHENNPQHYIREMERLNAEYALHLVRTDNRPNANISLSYGLNQYATSFKDAYHRPDRQQAASVTLSIPVFQWGITRNKLRIAQNEYNAVLLGQESELKNFKKEIQDYVFDYNMSRELIDVADKKYHLSAQQYLFASQKFKLGKVAAIELTNANKDFLQAKQNYISVLKSLFISYYKIRHISLHDFIEDKDLTDLIQTSL